MGLIQFLITLVLLGVALYLVETYIPMSPPIKTLLRIVVVVVIVIWLLWLVLAITGDVPIPRVR